MKRQTLVILAACLMMGQTAMGQSLTPAPSSIEKGEMKAATLTKATRPKVAVVLSGGGAKGMAHIGALKVIERAGIPIDIITGTSMGSIVGGLYACGNSTEKLDSIVRAQDWTFVLSDKDDLSHQSLLEREKKNTYIISTSLNLGGKSPGAGGLVIGKNINTLFNAFTAPYNDSIDFNTLPIPFACVATNIVDNTEHDFHSGVLSMAMRASMSIPGAFSPIRMGDKLLVDGGLRNNFPADIAKEMGADYIIGVTVQGKEKTADDIGSTAAVLSQIIDVNCKNKYEENLAITDIPIRVNTTGYGSASFNRAAIDTLIRRGEEEAMKHWDELVELRNKLGITHTADIAKLHQRILIKHKPLVQPKAYKIGALQFINLSRGDELFIRNKFNLHEGDSIDTYKAELITTSLRLDLFYKTADYQIEGNGVTLDDGSTAAKILFIVGDKKTNEVSVGIRFDNEEKVALQANAAFPIRTKMPMELDFTTRLGKRSFGKLMWAFHPMSFIRPTVTYKFAYNDIDIYEYGKKSYNITYSQNTLNVSPLNFNVRNFDISIGGEWNYYHFRNLLTDVLPEHQKSMPDDRHLISYVGQVNYNSEDEWYFPTRGAKFNARFAYVTDNFVKMKGETGLRDYSAMWRMSFPMGKHLSVQPMLYGRMLFGKNPPFIISNTVGGEWFGHYFEQQMPFAGMGYVEQAWDKFVAAQMQAQVKLGESNIILWRFGAGQNADELKDLLDYRTMLGGSLGYYYNTMFGPLGATVGYNNISKKVSFFVNLGFVF